MRLSPEIPLATQKASKYASFMVKSGRDQDHQLICDFVHMLDVYNIIKRNEKYHK